MEEGLKHREEKIWQWESWRKVLNTGKRKCSIEEVGGRRKTQGREIFVLGEVGRRCKTQGKGSVVVGNFEEGVI